MNIEGYVTQTRYRAISDLPASVTTGYGAGVTPVPVSVSELRALESTTSWRSGPSYLRAIDEGAKIAPDSISQYGRYLGDTGHEFSHEREIWSTSRPHGGVVKAGLSNFYGALFFRPSTVEGSLPPGGDGYATRPPKWSMVNLNSAGSGLINRASPIKQQANLVQSLLETLKDGIPTALFSALIDPSTLTKRGLVKSLAGDYLNSVFAWTPLMRDFDSLLKTIQKIDDICRQMVGGSGKELYRKRSLPPYRSETTLVRRGSAARPTFVYPSSSDGYLTTSPVGGTLKSAVYSTFDTRDVWFSGSFTYYLEKLLIPEAVSIFLAGMEPYSGGKYIDPTKLRGYIFEYAIGARGNGTGRSLAWELTPFSWLIDWFVNVGVVLDNQRMFNELGLVMHYGYLMVEETRHITSEVEFLDGTSAACHYRYLRQRRVRAHPFGFGLTDGGLSAQQTSVLGALATNLLLRSP